MLEAGRGGWSPGKSGVHFREQRSERRQLLCEGFIIHIAVSSVMSLKGLDKDNRGPLRDAVS